MSVQPARGATSSVDLDNNHVRRSHPIGETIFTHMVKGRSEGAFALFNELIEGGAYLDGKNADGETPLDIAMRTKQVEMIDLLQKNGARRAEELPKHTEGDAIDTDDPLLIRLARRNDYEGVQDLIDLGVNLDQQGTEGDTALHVAARTNAFGVALLLLVNNADPNIRNDRGETPMLAAFKFSNNALVEFLCEKGGLLGLELTEA